MTTLQCLGPGRSSRRRRAHGPPRRSQGRPLVLDTAADMVDSERVALEASIGRGLAEADREELHSVKDVLEQPPPDLMRDIAPPFDERPGQSTKNCPEDACIADAQRPSCPLLRTGACPSAGRVPGPRDRSLIRPSGRVGRLGGGGCGGTGLELALPLVAALTSSGHAPTLRCECVARDAAVCWRRGSRQC